MKLGPKALDCLRIAEARELNKWEPLYVAMCSKYSEKIVTRKMLELSRRGYIEYGVSVRTGWLTDKGKLALATGQGIDPT